MSHQAMTGGPADRGWDPRTTQFRVEAHGTLLQFQAVGLAFDTVTFTGDGGTVTIPVAFGLTKAPATNDPLVGIVQQAAVIGDIVDVIVVGKTQAIALTSFSAGAVIGVDTTAVKVDDAATGKYGIALEAAGALDDIVSIVWYGWKLGLVVA